MKKDQNYIRLTLLGVGAMNSPCYAPAGLLVEYCRDRVMIDGGQSAEPKGKLNAWLLTDIKNELIAVIRSQARAHGREPGVGTYSSGPLLIKPKPVVHTSRPTYGYLITVGETKIVWAPEFLEFPGWARRADIMFAEAAGWNRSIRFAGGVGGHAPALRVATEAKKKGVKQLVLAHIGRPTIKALKAGEAPPFGRFGTDSEVFLIPIRRHKHR
jgi:hypothetical protein